MKQTLKPGMHLKLKPVYNASKQESLHILSLNHDELKVFLQEKASLNPYLTWSRNPMDSDAFLNYAQAETSLMDTILDQAAYSTYHPQKDICIYLLNQLDSNGYFTCSYRELIQKSPYPKELLVRHIAILKTFEPVGCFSFNLKDCLQTQIQVLKMEPKSLLLDCCEYLEDLALHHEDIVHDKTGYTIEDIQAGFKIIQTLNPKPAASFSTSATVLQPEFRIEVIDDKIQIIALNADMQVAFSPLDETNEAKEVRDYLKQQKKEAQAIMSHLQKRNSTLLLIMQQICEAQQDFFLYDGNLHHLTMQQVADAINMHVSTVSRAIANKSFEFNHRYYSLREMFVNGGSKEATSMQIKNYLQTWIQNEDKHRPYSDEDLRILLAKVGITISRRTVAKYRESLYIYNSQKRKINPSH